MGIVHDVHLGANYTYTKTKDEDTGNEFGRRPTHQAAVFLDWDYIEAGNIYLVARYVGTRFDDNANTVKLKQYIVTDISTRYVLNDNFEVFGRIENLLDKEYETIRGYKGLERAFYAGIKGMF